MASHRRNKSAATSSSPAMPARRTLSKRIRSEQELKQLIDVISLDLGHVHDRLRLFQRISNIRGGRD